MKQVSHPKGGWTISCLDRYEMWYLYTVICSLFLSFRGLLSPRDLTISATPLQSQLLFAGQCIDTEVSPFQRRPWFFNMPGVKHRYMGPRFNVSSERLLVILVGRPRESNPLPRDYKSHALPIELTGPAYIILSLLKNNLYHSLDIFSLENRLDK